MKQAAMTSLLSKKKKVRKKFIRNLIEQFIYVIGNFQLCLCRRCLRAIFASFGANSKAIDSQGSTTEFRPNSLGRLASMILACQFAALRLTADVVCIFLFFFKSIVSTGSSLAHVSICRFVASYSLLPVFYWS